MKKGGYHIIDFGDVNITATGVTVPGIHKAIESSYRKAILISGVTLNGVEQRDCFVDCAKHGASGDYTFGAYAHVFVISAEDKVTIS